VLAALVQYVKTKVPGAARDTMMVKPVIGYSIAFPMVVIAMIAYILALKRFRKAEKELL
jgi:hypothetical protein